MNLGEIQRLQRNQPVGYRIVQLAVDARALVMMTVLCGSFVLQKTNLQNEKPILTEETIY